MTVLDVVVQGAIPLAGIAAAIAIPVTAGVEEWRRRKDEER